MKFDDLSILAVWYAKPLFEKLGVVFPQPPKSVKNEYIYKGVQKMTYQGFIVFYDEHEIPLKKCRYNNQKRRKKLIELGKKIFKDDLAFYEIIPYVYVYPNSIKPINV